MKLRKRAGEWVHPSKNDTGQKSCRTQSQWQSGSVFPRIKSLSYQALIGCFSQRGLKRVCTWAIIGRDLLSVCRAVIRHRCCHSDKPADGNRHSSVLKPPWWSQRWRSHLALHTTRLWLWSYFWGFLKLGRRILFGLIKQREVKPRYFRIQDRARFRFQFGESSIT